jgi:hypothetical protein
MASFFHAARWSADAKPGTQSRAKIFRVSESAKVRIIASHNNAWR